MASEARHSGWRVVVEGDTVAFDNRPLTDRAKSDGDPYPEPQRCVVPHQVLKAAQTLWELENGIVQPFDPASA